ncbi:MAG: hypothetical protein J6X58_01720 [Bacteroidales bacterium]|nr:hypothetical protein [Bacteroidales bacterium]
MKNKYFFGILLLSAILTMTSCEGIDFNFDGDNDLDHLVGDASITITMSDSNAANGIRIDTVTFTSSIVDAFTQKVSDTTDEWNVAALDISAKIDLTTTASISFPFMYIRMSDTIANTYPMTNILTLDVLLGLNYNVLLDLFADPYGGNTMIIVESDTSWFIANSGDIIITDFPLVGHIVAGNFQNIQAFYVTQSNINKLNQDVENYDYSHVNDISYYFPQATISGNIASRRMSAIHNLVEEAFNK